MKILLVVALLFAVSNVRAASQLLVCGTNYGPVYEGAEGTERLLDQVSVELTENWYPYYWVRFSFSEMKEIFPDREGYGRIQFLLNIPKTDCNRQAEKLNCTFVPRRDIHQNGLLVRFLGQYENEAHPLGNVYVDRFAFEIDTKSKNYKISLAGRSKLGVHFDGYLDFLEPKAFSISKSFQSQENGQDVCSFPK